MTDPGSLEPVRDAGSDTFDRYLYQAEVTFPFCLECALGGEIKAVVPEHLEDIALEYERRWRFIQVKSRDPERGLWTLADLLGSSGALQSLYKTHRLTIGSNATLELLLEGATKAKDPIRHLLRDGNALTPLCLHASLTAWQLRELRLQSSSPA